MRSPRGRRPPFCGGDTLSDRDPFADVQGPQSGGLAPAHALVPLTATRSAQAIYPVDALGPILGPATRVAAAYAMVPPSIAAQSTLAACSLAVQAHFDVKLPTGQVRPTTLHMVSVAESGDRKSTVDDFVMQPVWQYQDRLELEREAQDKSAALAQSAYDEARKATTQQFKNKGREALEEAYRALGERPELPTDPTIVIRSGTTQGLLKRFQTHRPSMGLMSDEGGSWLGGFGMSEDARLHTIATLSDFWDGKTVQMNTGGEGFTALRGRRLAFHLMIQPVLCPRLLGNSEAQGQGFLSRLLVAFPDSIAGTRIVDPTTRGRAEDQAVVDQYRGRLERILAAPLPVREGTNELTPRAVELSPDAQAMWWDFYNSIEVRLGPDGDLNGVKGFVGKLPEQAARIAANLAVFEHGVSIASIDTVMLARGIALAEFYLSEASRLFGMSEPDALLVEAQILSDWLQKDWSENLISASVLQQRGPGKLRKGADHWRKLLEVLERNDHVTKQPNGGMVSGAKVREAWRVIRG